MDAVLKGGTSGDLRTGGMLTTYQQTFVRAVLGAQVNGAGLPENSPAIYGWVNGPSPMGSPFRDDRAVLSSLKGLDEFVARKTQP